ATVSNGASADAVGGLTIRMNLPNGATFGTVSCAVTTEGTGTPVTACGAKAGSGPDWYTAAALAKGGAVKVTFEVNFHATFVGEKTVDVKVSRSAAPVVDATKALDLTSPADPKVEVTKVFVAPAATRCPNSTDDATKYTPGCLARYRVEVTNAGPGHTVGAAFSLGLTEATSNTSIRWA